MSSQIANYSQHIKFKHPFNCLIAGPSGSGKTKLVREIIDNSDICIDNLENIKILWAYGIWQKTYTIPLKKNEITYMEGIPNEDDIESFNVIVLDDLITEINNSKFIVDLFTKISHHRNISVFILSQNIFYRSPIYRDISLNAHYIIIFKSPRDSTQINVLARQICGSNWKFFISAFDQATDHPYGYLLVDLKQDTPIELRLRTRVLPNESNKLDPIIFVDNNNVKKFKNMFENYGTLQ